MSKTDLVQGLELVGHISQKLRAAESDSLIEYTKPVRVEPVTLVDMRASQLPYINELLHSVLNMFAGYYNQAVSLSVNVNGINVLQLFDSLNPQRSPIDALSGSSKSGWAELADFAGESFEDANALFIPGEYTHESEGALTGSVSDSSKTMSENYNLSVGKLLEINVGDGQRNAKFQILTRLRTQELRPQIFIDTLALDTGVDDSLFKQMKDRWHGWRSGQLSFIEDILLAQDLIEKHRKNLMDDQTDYYKRRRRDRRRNRLSALISGRPSVAGASSIFVMTSETAREFERKFRGSLDRFRDREKFFSNTHGMILVVVDPDWEQVTIYHRSIEEPTEITVREIQRMHKKGGPDIMEILNAFRQSKSPVV